MSNLADLISRLRSERSKWGEPCASPDIPNMCEESADEIERLSTDCEKLAGENSLMRNEIRRLNDLLKYVGSDDQLLHEIIWSAESFIRSVKQDGRSVISPGTAADFVKLHDCCDRVRNEWRVRWEKTRSKEEDSSEPS